MTGDTPVDLVYRQLRGHAVSQAGETQSLSINGHPAAIARGEFANEAFGGVQLAFFVGAVVPTSGHAVIVEYHCINADSSDEGLLKRVMQSIQFTNEPTLSAQGSRVQLPSIADIQLPEDLPRSTALDENQTFREARSTDPAVTMRRLHLYPIVMQSRDSASTIRTMLSLTQSGFTDARVSEVKTGEFRIDPDANAADRGVRPICAYALTGNAGRGFLAVLKGGDGEQWMDDAWQFLRDKSRIETDLNIAALDRQVQWRWNRSLPAA